MPKYRKKPIVIEAFQWDGIDPDGSSEVWPDWAFSSHDIDYIVNENYPSGALGIKTLEGEIYAVKNDYIIQGVNGEIYPCKPDIFKKEL